MPKELKYTLKDGSVITTGSLMKKMELSRTAASDRIRLVSNGERPEEHLFKKKPVRRKTSGYNYDSTLEHKEQEASRRRAAELYAEFGKPFGYWGGRDN